MINLIRTKITLKTIIESEKNAFMIGFRFDFITDRQKSNIIF